MFFSPSSESLSILTVYVNDVEHIILDNLQFMTSRKELQNRSFDKFDVQDVAIEKFRKFATEKNVHISLVVHPRKEQEDSKLTISSIYGSAKATQEADTVIILQTDAGRRKYLDVKKNRFNGNLGTTPLYFDPRSGRYSNDPIVGGHGEAAAPSQASRRGHEQATTVAVRPVPNTEDYQAGLLSPEDVKSM